MPYSFFLPVWNVCLNVEAHCVLLSCINWEQTQNEGGWDCICFQTKSNTASSGQKWNSICFTTTLPCSLSCVSVSSPFPLLFSLILWPPLFHLPIYCSPPSSFSCLSHIKLCEQKKKNLNRQMKREGRWSRSVCLRERVREGETGRESHVWEAFKEALLEDNIRSIHLLYTSKWHISRHMETI